MKEQEPAVSPRQTAFLERLAEAEGRLMAAISGLEPEVLCTEQVAGTWTIKDLLGHMVSWDEEFRAKIAAILAGSHPGYDHQISGKADFSASNQVWFERKRDRPLEEILDNLERDFAEAGALIRRLTPEEMRQRGVTPWRRAAVTQPAKPSKKDTDSVATLVTFHWRHINQHCRQIERWRKKWEGRN